MAGHGGVLPAGEALRYAEYSPPQAKRSDTDIDRGLARSLVAVGLGIAALGFAGHYAFQIWKPLGQVITETAKKISAPTFSSYYKGGFEQKMSRREASLILGQRRIQATSATYTIAHRIEPASSWFLVGFVSSGSPYLATKINEAKDLLEATTKH
uniref:DnaJ homolog subfamily C member 15 n=1 Tax=Sus scrofa TaxID=9823 RepID=A0A8D1LND8_PIG